MNGELSASTLPTCGTALSLCCFLLGVPPRTVMHIVRHTVMEMAMERYEHVNLDDQREALNLRDQALR